MEKNLESKLVELLVSDATKEDIAKLLIQNGVEISDEDLDTIAVKHLHDGDIDDVPYELSSDGLSFKIEDINSKMSKELKASFVRIPSKAEARFLEDIYYQTQDKRIAIEGQIRSLKQDSDSKSSSKESNDNNMGFLEWHGGNMKIMEI